MKHCVLGTALVSEVREREGEREGGWVDGWMDGWRDGRMDGWVGGWRGGGERDMVKTYSHGLQKPRG